MSRLLWFVSTLVVAVNAQCFNTCPGVTFDHDCDDGGTGSEFALCALGTDCADCGDRGQGCNCYCDTRCFFHCNDGWWRSDHCDDGNFLTNCGDVCCQPCPPPPPSPSPPPPPPSPSPPFSTSGSSGDTTFGSSGGITCQQTVCDCECTFTGEWLFCIPLSQLQTFVTSHGGCEEVRRLVNSCEGAARALPQILPGTTSSRCEQSTSSADWWVYVCVVAGVLVGAAIVCGSLCAYCLCCRKSRAPPQEISMSRSIDQQPQEISMSEQPQDISMSEDKATPSPLPDRL